MARLIKTGLDYFSMDVNTDDKFELIEAKHGIAGFGIVIKLFQRIYKSGYYLDWNDEKLLIFKKQINVDINIINDVINDCLRYNIFDEKLFAKYKILTSSGIQKRYFRSCERRKSVDIIKNYINVDINSIDVNINWINDDISTQRKGKESKVKERKGKREEIPPPQKVFLLEISQVEEFLLNEQIWLEQTVCMRHGLNKEIAKELIHEFVETLKDRAEEEKTPKDAKQHFVNWLKIKKEKQKNETAKNRNNNSKEYRQQLLMQEYKSLVGKPVEI